MQLSEQYELFRHFSVISLFHFPCYQRNFLLEVNGPSHPLQCSCLENPRDGEPGGLPSMGSHRVGHD